MAAYGAAISLKTTIRRILQSSRTSLVPPSRNILKPAYEAMDHLQEVLLELEGTGYSKIRTEVNALDDRIKESIWEFEDLLESHFYDQILPQLESSSSGGESDHMSFFVDLQSLRKRVDSFVKRVTVMEAEYDIELANMPEEESEPISSRIDFCGIDSKMVGLSNEFERVRNHLLAEDRRNWSAIIGMAGVGKTTLAKKVFDDPSIQTHFELRAWVKVGRKCEPKETLQCILAQVDPNNHGHMLTKGDDRGDEELLGVLEERLKDKKCLIVLDDIWEWNSRVMDILPQENARILFTSRLTMHLPEANARVLHKSKLRMKESSSLRLRLLDEGESKKLLAEKVFGEEGFPIHLEKLGEKIAKKCEGLPLMIVKVAELLSKEDKTVENWTEVAEKQQNSVFVNAYDQISEVLYPSYNYLPQYLKMLFLYLGAFPPYADIKIHNLLRQLIAEGFVEAFGKQNLDDFIVDCTVKLSRGYHLVLLESDQQSMLSRHEFRVHSCWQHMCKKEASMTKFLHVLQSWDDDDDIMKNQRRLCVHYNTLFAFKEVCDSIKSECASTVRSLLCLGPYHKYPVPIDAMFFKLLRVLDALAVRFYHIPLEIMKLVCLKYIALTCNAELPNSISNLFHLQTLIIHPHTCIRKRGALSYMPVEIWDMQELQQIEVIGRDLPAPNSDATLHKLSFLFGVTAKSCTREILKRIPNLERLEIQVELKPYDDDNDSNPLSSLGYISEELRNLEVLRYHVENPKMEHESIIPLSMFPSSLTSLYLSGFGCPWKHINDICSLLPNLMVLSLEQYAFRGSEWEIESGYLLKLEELIIEDTNLVRWRARHGSLPRLRLLSIHHCYKLQQLDWTRDPSMVTTPTIELVECNPLAVASAMQLSPESLFRVRCYSSF